MVKVHMYLNSGAWGGTSKYLADPLVAHLPGVKLAVKGKAAEGLVRSQAKLMSHRDEGYSHISLKSGKTDAYIVLTDHDRSGSAISIEGETGALAASFGLGKIQAPTHRVTSNKESDARKRAAYRRNRQANRRIRRRLGA